MWVKRVVKPDWTSWFWTVSLRYAPQLMKLSPETRHSCSSNVCPKKFVPAPGSSGDMSGAAFGRGITENVGIPYRVLRLLPWEPPTSECPGWNSNVIVRTNVALNGSEGPRDRLTRGSTGVVPIGTTLARSVMYTTYLSVMVWAFEEVAWLTMTAVRSVVITNVRIHHGSHRPLGRPR